jgi:beta-alanine degradation protein BauB
MKRVLAHSTFLSVMLTLFLATAQAQDPTKVGPNIYKKLFENDRVRMLEVSFAPGDSIAFHSHPDHAVYAVTGGTLRVTVKGGKTEVADLKAGDPLWFPAVTHAAKNIGHTSLKLVVVELKEKAPKK